VHSLEESIRRKSPMASKENKCKCADEEEEEVAEESTVMSKKRRVSGNNNDDDSDDSSSSVDDFSLEEEVSSEEEPAWRARSDDGDTTDSENDSIKNDGDTSDDGSDGNDMSNDDSDGNDDQFSDDAFDQLISCSINYIIVVLVLCNIEWHFALSMGHLRFWHPHVTLCLLRADGLH
jgi:hypothetical protein